MRWFENPNYNFIGNRRKAYLFSGILILISILSLAIRGLEYGIDFRGGMEFVVETSQPLNEVEVRGVLTDVLGSEPEVKKFGSPTDLLIRTVATGEITEIQNKILDTLKARYPDVSFELVKTDIVGPRFAEDLKRGALYAIIGSLIVIFLYILLRFEWRYSLGAVAALAHDVTITLGIFSLLHGVVPFSLEVDQAVIAALLTIVGYSLNDTVVVFDRVREYTNIFKAEPYPRVVNKAINTTLSRTLITSGTTLLVVVVLFIFGGEVLRPFAFALIIGIVIGTYSSIFVASPIVVELHERTARKKQTR